MSVRLYHFEACPYCEKVRVALKRIDLRYESVEIDPADRSAVKEISGQELVPVLADGEVVVHDSTRILRYLVRTHGGGRLLPEDARTRGLAWIVEEYVDEVLIPLFRRSARGVSPEGKPLDEAGRAALRGELGHHFEALEQVLGTGDYLLGGRPTLADIALYGAVSRLELYSPRGIPPEHAKIRDWYSRMKA